MRRKLFIAFIAFCARFSKDFKHIQETIKAYEEVCAILIKNDGSDFGKAEIEYIEKDLQKFRDAFKEMACPYPGDQEFYEMYRNLLSTGRNWIGCSFMCVSITNREILLYSIAIIQGREHKFNFNI